MWCESDEWATTLEGSNSLQTMKWRHIMNDKIGSILIYLNQHSIYLCHSFHRSLLLTQCFPSIPIFSTPIWCMQLAICDMYVYINDRITIALTLQRQIVELMCLSLTIYKRAASTHAHNCVICRSYWTTANVWITHHVLKRAVYIVPACMCCMYISGCSCGSIEAISNDHLYVYHNAKWWRHEVKVGGFIVPRCNDHVQSIHLKIFGIEKTM